MTAGMIGWLLMPGRCTLFMASPNYEHSDWRLVSAVIFFDVVAPINPVS
jgi:hypothetical protein